MKTYSSGSICYSIQLASISVEANERWAGMQAIKRTNEHLQIRLDLMKGIFRLKRDVGRSRHNQCIQKLLNNNSPDFLCTLKIHNWVWLIVVFNLFCTCLQLIVCMSTTPFVVLAVIIQRINRQNEMKSSDVRLTVSVWSKTLPSVEAPERWQMEIQRKIGWDGEFLAKCTQIDFFSTIATEIFSS